MVSFHFKNWLLTTVALTSIIGSGQANEVTEGTCTAKGITDTDTSSSVFGTPGGGLRRLQTATEAVISNGRVVLGVLQTGGLNTDSAMGYSPANPTGSRVISSVGLRYIFPDGSEYEATSWGCPCEGWGVAFDSDEVYTNKGRTTSMSTATLTGVTGDSAISTTTSVTGDIRVVHDFHPSPDTPYLYEVVVTITNTGTTDTSETLYRRLFDFDVPPNTYDECVTVQPDPSTVDSLLRATNNGFTNANPRSGIEGNSAPLTDSGPGDLGATFDFNLGPLAAGDSLSFRVFYGGTPNTAAANAALGAVGAEAFAIGKPSSGGGCSDGPAVFLFGFAGIGGETIFEEDGTTRTEYTEVPSGSGDPHFKTWKNEHFEFHGQCDLVFTKVKDFAKTAGVDLDIHIRTKMVRYWSFIESAAIRIGNDVLEVKGSAERYVLNYWNNFEHNGELTTLGGFPVSINDNKEIFTIDLDSVYPGQKIQIKTFKEFVSVKIIGGSEESFGSSVGIIGDFKSGQTVGRDGKTVLNNFNDLGLEWQVVPADGKLFHEVASPQFPELCLLPEDPRGDRARRLAESEISVEDAEAACASLKDKLDRKDCVYDVLATQDLDMVGAF